MRFSNVFDGLFHDKVVVTEADGDCRFFAAIADAIAPEVMSGARDPDVLFTPTFGKDRLLVIVKALRAIGVPTLAVADFDFLNSASRVEGFYGALGGTNWAQLKALLNQVTQAVESRKQTLDATLLKPFITEVLNKITGPVFDQQNADELKKRLKVESPWDEMKRVGISGLPGGVVYKACEQLLAQLEAVGLFVVRKGELESYDPSIGKHGPAWVAGVLTKDLKSDPTLQDARTFVRSLVNWKGPQAT